MRSSEILRLAWMNLAMVAATVAVLLGSAQSLTADQDAARQELALLVERLGSADYRHREAAQRDLLAIGPTATGHLSAATAHPDLEISLRAGQILRMLQCRSRWRGTAIRVPAQGVRAGSFLDAIERKTGIQIAFHELNQEADDPGFAMPQHESEFWPAVERIGSHLRVVPVWQFNTCGRSTLVGRTDRRLAVAFQGAFRCEVMSLEPGSPSTNESESHHKPLELTLRLSWEPKLQVVAVRSQPRLCWSGACRRGSNASCSDASDDAWHRISDGLPCCSVTFPSATGLHTAPASLRWVEWEAVALDCQGVEDRRTLRFDFGEALIAPRAAPVSELTANACRLPATR